MIRINRLLLLVAVQAAVSSTIVMAGDVEVQLPAAADAFTVDQPAGTELMRVNGDGNVGIGTATFEDGIFGSGTHMGQQITHKDGTAVQVLESYRDGGNHSKVWALANRGTKDSPAALNSGDFILELNASAYDGTNFDNAARIALGIDDNGTVTPGTSMPGKIVFRTSPDGSVGDQERMRIDSAGNVGIGTLEPDRKLMVGVENMAVRIDGFDTVKNIDISQLMPDGTSKFGGFIEGGDNGQLVFAVRDNDGGDGFVFIGGGGDYMTNTEYDSVLMKIKSDGDVGIGTVTPAAKLDVAGNIKVADAGQACNSNTEGQIRY